MRVPVVGKQGYLCVYTCGVGHRSTRDSVWFGGSREMGASSLQVACKVQGLGGELLSSLHPCPQVIHWSCQGNTPTEGWDVWEENQTLLDVRDCDSPVCEISQYQGGWEGTDICLGSSHLAIHARESERQFCLHAAVYRCCASTLDVYPHLHTLRGTAM